MDLAYSTSTVIGTTISGNTARDSSADGGGMHIRDSPSIIRNSIIKNNQASHGGGLYIVEDITHPTTVDVRETTFSANSGGQGYDIYTSGAPTISIVNTLFTQPTKAIYEQSGHATWNTCANNVCTDTPFTGTCTAVNNADAKYGVLCHYNNNYISKCSSLI